MKMKTKILDGIQYTTCILGITLNQMDDLLSIILSIVSIILCFISGGITIALKLKQMMADKKITKEELEDLKNTIEDVKGEIDERQHK